FIAAFESPESRVAENVALEGYPLYPWLEAKRLRTRLGRAGDQAVDLAIAEFLDVHGSAPHTQALRSAWWDALYANRRWRAFRTA
ncbi:hypothetical protein DF186_20070, partial [Enterococcus hirae]